MFQQMNTATPVTQKPSRWAGVSGWVIRDGRRLVDRHLGGGQPAQPVRPRGSSMSAGRRGRCGRRAGSRRRRRPLPTRRLRGCRPWRTGSRPRTATARQRLRLQDAEPGRHREGSEAHAVRPGRDPDGQALPDDLTATVGAQGAGTAPALTPPARRHRRPVARGGPTAVTRRTSRRVDPRADTTRSRNAPSGTNPAPWKNARACSSSAGSQAATSSAPASVSARRRR